MERSAKYSAFIPDLTAEGQVRPIVPRCNLCGGVEFVTHMGRDGERCAVCGSLRRHRIALEVYRRKGMLTPRQDGGPIRVLHLAPEYVLRKEIIRVVGAGYMCADSNPELYGSSQCLKLTLPQGFEIFPNDYFDYIIHNHVLEHIPGSFRSHLREFARILKPWGYHIFSVPGPDPNILTTEGGEHLANDSERLEHFGQRDHLKRFGRDLADAVAQLPNGQFSRDNISDEDRAALNVAKWSNRFLIWRKGRSVGSRA